jgi:Flp pilus assembly protein TadG
MTRFRIFGSERGTVMVLAGVALFPIMFLAAFAIDVSHWWDYSRNLQNRADAAALAGAAAYGNTCFAGGAPGSTATGNQSLIGKWAQLYSGAGVNETAGNLPYTDGAVAGPPYSTTTGPGTGWNVTTNGYINNTIQGPVNSPLTLRLGSLNDFWLVLNGRDYAENGGTSFTMNSSNASDFCGGAAASDPHWDQTECPSQTPVLPCTGSGIPSAAAMIDVKVSQRRLPLFFPLISGRPTLHAHARAMLEGEASSPSEPIAVGDNGFTPCVSVKVFDPANPTTPMQTVALSRVTPANQSGPVQWDNSGSIPGGATPDTTFQMPSSGNVYLQPYLNDCNGNGVSYDSDTNTGLLMINNHPASAPSVASGQQPQINTNGVTVSGGPCPNATTQYFSVGACPVTVNAGVTFASDVTPAVKAKVFYIDRTWDNTNNVWVTSPPVQLSRPGTGGCPAAFYCGDPTIPDTSGIHQFVITWEEDAGNIGGTDCSANPTPAVCKGSFGIQAQTFAACNGCDQPDDSGPVIYMRVSDNGLNDANTMAGGSLGHSLVFTVKVAGLGAATFGDPATVLRFPTSGNHQTGLIDCGQGTGTNADSYVVYYGCGPQNPQFNPPLNSLFINTRNTCGTPPGPPWPVAGQQDCVQTTPGTRRQGIICPLVLRVVGAPLANNCNQNVGTCPVNYWTKNQGNIDDAGDPRALTFIITSAVDLASVAGSPQGWVPIRRFATFYITGWDSAVAPQCPSQGQYVGNEPFPIKGKQNSQNAAVWGHWINYSDSAGTGNNQPCDLTSLQPINCVPVLTR